MLKYPEKVIETILNIKLKTYNIIILFVISLLVPGVLILFYFFRNYFETCSIAKFILLAISFSSAFVFVAYLLSLWSFVIILLHYGSESIGKNIENENEFFEIVVIVGVLNSLLGFFISLTIAALLWKHNFTVFVISYVIIEIVLGVLWLVSLFDMLSTSNEKVDNELRKKRRKSVKPMK